jgi:S-formylglutathione hydrolase FrmB
MMAHNNRAVRILIVLFLVLAACTPVLTDPEKRTGGEPGRVVEARFFSTALGVEKSYLAWLPPGYDAETSRRWPVVYYLHGLGGNERDWISGGHLEDAARAVGLRAIVVMPDGDESFYVNAVHPLPCGGGVDCVQQPRYEDYLVQDLVAHVDATYRTATDRRARGIAGLSMGGFGALGLAMRHSDRFAAAASHSGVVALLYAGPHPYVPGRAQIGTDVSRWGDAFGAIGSLVRNIFGGELATWRAHDPAVLAETLKPGRLSLYLDCGTEDRFALQDEAAYLHDVLTAHGIAHEYAITSGRHDFSFWRRRVYDSLDFFRRTLSVP